jgi:hypothetical protein
MRHHGVGSISEKTHVALLDIRIRLMHPQSPWLDLLANSKMSEDLAVELWIRLEEILNRKTIRAPCLCGVVALLSGEEAVV